MNEPKGIEDSFSGRFKIDFWQSKADKELSQLMDESLITPGLLDVVKYSTLGGGKRIRPLLCLAIFADLGENPLEILRPSLALELLHCSSLIHDDLPALDNDDYRRGKLSAHKAFGEAEAILAGDVLIALVSDCIESSNFHSDKQVRMYRAILTAFSKLCSGQYLDLQNSERAGVKLQRVHELKTGSLFEASASIAAIAADLNGEAYAAIVNLGKSLGVYFQEIDDFRDRHSSLSETGKSKRSDEANNRKTRFSNVSREQGIEILQAISADKQSQIIDLNDRGVLRGFQAIESVCKLITSGIVVTD
jgi:geranylgeranyl diphosphate synthase, type II